MNNTVLGENYGKCEKTEILNLPHPKEKETIWCQSQIIMKQFFAENLLAIERKKTQRTLNKPASLELAISDISKITMYDF